MSFYVVVPSAASSQRKLDMAIKLHQHGLSEIAEYSHGGWIDNEMCIAQPHLKFDRSDDATAYALSVGAVVHTEVPFFVK